MVLQVPASARPVVYEYEVGQCQYEHIRAGKMSQPLLFAVEIVDPDEVESEEKRLARMNAYDVWTAAFYRRFYTERAARIRASGDPVRIRLYEAWQARQRQVAA